MLGFGSSSQMLGDLACVAFIVVIMSLDPGANTLPPVFATLSHLCSLN